MKQEMKSGSSKLEEHNIMGKVPIRDLTGMYRCNCGRQFFDDDSAREHMKDCDEMPHIGDTNMDNNT